MTPLRAQIEKQTAALAQAESIQTIIDRLKFKVDIVAITPARHESDRKGKTLKFETTCSFWVEFPVGSDDILDLIVPRLQAFAANIAEGFDNLKPNLIEKLEAHIKTLISPTVTVQANGVNVEVK